jgi:hypothetical protein
VVVVNDHHEAPISVCTTRRFFKRGFTDTSGAEQCSDYAAALRRMANNTNASGASVPWYDWGTGRTRLGAPTAPRVHTSQ